MTFFQWCLLIMLRYLQTSMDNARKRGRPKGLGRGYILEHMPCSCMEELIPLEDEGELTEKEKGTFNNCTTFDKMYYFS